MVLGETSLSFRLMSSTSFIYLSIYSTGCLTFTVFFAMIFHTTQCSSKCEFLYESYNTKVFGNSNNKPKESFIIFESAANNYRKSSFPLSHICERYKDFANMIL